MKTAICIATYNSSNLLYKTLCHLEKLQPQPTYYIIMENNSTDKTMDILKIWKLYHPNTIIIRLWFVKNALKKLGNPYAIIGLARELLLKKVRQLNVDYAIFIDDDIIVKQTDFITRITKHNLPIVGGPYLRTFSIQVDDKIGEVGVYIASKWFNNTPEGKYLLKSGCEPKLQEVAMTSAGCLCLNKTIIQDKRLHFYPVRPNCSEDFGFCLESRDLGYKVYLDGTIQLDHMFKGYRKPWTETVTTIDFEF